MTYRLKVATIVCESEWDTDFPVDKWKILKDYSNKFEDCVISLTEGGK
ncbi:MAG: hypothetical protein PHY73_02000 [Candidatus Omnitrophica bacterium]|nr:hypothetical protein [Candidatus Omnitrophota bacterium]